ncbi:MAG TPA: DUF262 domain-containing protein [Lacipirellulaceae bacterium]|nr:DUF262 domain-containing protein [Lacipirellulaceae bacterium]HMP06413.1 DUF262 domain-containing protein [Lacipirellulaceae bacterium]
MSIADSEPARKMLREQNFQNIAWFKDLHARGRLDMDPPYQRRSVWNRKFQEEFVDTVLLGYPSPAIFLYETISESGANYAVVDGKQRLTAVFEFIANSFPVGPRSPIEKHRGLYYEGLPREVREAILRYRFSVESLPSINEEELNNIFDRLNRNVKKLSPQELRHAKYDGVFITHAEQMSDWLADQFNLQFPRIAEMSRRQMKDVEIVASLLLFLEEGAKGYSTATLDAAFSSRDEDWPRSGEFVEEFQEAIRYLQRVVRDDGQPIATSRMRNQADFYSLFGAVATLNRTGDLPNEHDARQSLLRFLELLDSPKPPPRATEYLEAARSASNDAGARTTRIAVVRDVLLNHDLGTSDGAN